MFNHNERCTLTTMAKTVNKELIKIEVRIEESEEQWKQYQYQYEELYDDSALSKYEDELQRWKDLNDKKKLLTWLRDHFNCCVSGLEILDDFPV